MDKANNVGPRDFACHCRRSRGERLARQRVGLFGRRNPIGSVPIMGPPTHLPRLIMCAELPKRLLACFRNYAIKSNLEQQG